MSPITTVRRFAANQLHRAGIGRLYPSNPMLQQRRFFDALLLERLDAAGDAFFFVQIGANDGTSFDTLYENVTRRGVAGLVIEPVQQYFDELARNYANHPRITAVRAAIHATEAEIDLYRVSDSAVATVGEWSKGIASVDPEHHKKSGTATEHIVTERVPCVSWRGLLDEHDVTRVDYLQIDTEGYDLPILRMVVDALGRCRPEVIKFEHLVDTGVMTTAELGEALTLLTVAGYHVTVGTNDAIAWTFRRQGYANVHLVESGDLVVDLRQPRGDNVRR